MTELTKWIHDSLEENDWDNTKVYALYVQCPYRDVITYSGFERKVRKVKLRYGPEAESVFVPRSSANGVLNPNPHQEGNHTTFHQEGNEATVDLKTDRITTLEELLEHAKIDLSIWKVERFTVNKWEMGTVIEGKAEAVPLFQVKATLVKIVLDDPVIPIIQPLSLPHLPWVGTRNTRAQVKRTLVIGDAQIGFNRNYETGEMVSYHDWSAMMVVLQMLEDVTFDNIVILGDMLDLTEASKYIQRPEFHMTMQPSINDLGKFLVNIRQLAPQARIAYMCGNHEERLQKSLIENFKFAYGLKAYGDSVPFYSLRKLLDLDSIDVEFIEAYPSGQFWINDETVVVHGEYTKLATESKVANVNTIMGHLHKEETISKTLQERYGIRSVKAVTCGCLCKIDGTVPGMTSRPNWQNGVVVVEEGADSHIININHITIKDGFATFNGMYYNGNT